VIINYEKENEFLDVSKTVFWTSPELRSPMGSNTAAFSSRQAADKVKAGKEGQVFTWDELYKKIK
ncbi:MAG: nitrous oxide reductase accessory protein NosL, partial [Chitinophagaceae bacterium]